MRRVGWAIVVLGVLAAAGGAAAQRRLDEARIRDILERRIDDLRRGVGIVVGVIDAEGRQIISHGRMRSGGEREPDGATVFEIGSITKVFTSILLAEMVARGEVGLDDPVADLLPGVRMPESEGRPITLRDLATHRSGLPRDPTNLTPSDDDNPFADYGVEQMYAFLDGYELTRAVGARHEYSNLAVGLLGHALALRAGMDYESLVVARVADPLGLHDTRIALTAEQRSRLATGHGLVGQPVASWDFPTLAGAGSLRSTTDDLLDFLAVNMGLSASPLAEVLAATHQRQADTGSPGLSMGLGWHILQAAGNRILWHNGGTFGYRTFAGFDPDRQLGVVVLSNSGTDVTDIGLHLFDGVFALAPLTPVPEVVELDPALLDDYVGAYELAPGLILTVTREGDELFVELTGQGKFAVWPMAENRFFHTLVDAQITFVKDEGGQVTQLTLHQAGIDQDARRLPDPTAVLERFTTALPEDSSLDQNYPNPFNSRTVVPFALAAAAVVELGVYNVHGQRVATLASGWRQAGTYSLHWDGRDDAGRALASGIYVYRMRVGGEAVAARKLIVVR